VQKEHAAEQERQAAEAERQRRELEQTRALASAEQRRAEVEARSARRLRWMLAAVVVALLLAAGAAIYAFHQRHEAREATKRAVFQRTLAEAAKATALAAQKEAEAAKAQLLGKTAEAESLRAQAEKFSADALRANQLASLQKQQLSAAGEGRLNQVQTERDQLKKPSLTKTNPKDGLPYVWIVPGEFWMGDNNGFVGEKPRHRVRITKGFWLGETLVTVAAYKRFISERPQFKMPHAPGFNPDWSKPDHPIVDVTWDEAQSYCEWAGGRLPDEAQWEYAARGGKDGLRYPWGNEDTLENANCGGSKWGGTSPVRSYAANAWGLYDMIGNAYEWVADWYDEDYYATLPSDKPAEDPRGPDRRTGARVMRGGSFDSDLESVGAAARGRPAPGRPNSDVGFRCVREVIP
jgi:formylglycine-generating enzyme required for sulfatase activity